MPTIIHDLIPSAEGHRARSRPMELPRCDGLRACAALTAIAQYLITTRASETLNLGFAVRVGFAVSGFLLARFLLRERVEASNRRRGVASNDRDSWGRSLVQALPVSSMIVVVVGVLYLPQLLALESLPIPDPNELPAWIDRNAYEILADFQQFSFEGRSLIAWPLVILLAPRRWLGLVFLGVLGSGLMAQFSGLLSGEVRPASILVNPSPLDLISAGAMAAAMFHGDGGSDNGRLGRWAMLMGLVLAAASIGFRYQDGLPNWGSVAMLSAPPGFGAVNFILKIVATTLVATLSWRDISGMMDGLKRSPAH